MDFSHLFHRPQSEFCFARDQTNVCIRLRSKRCTLDNVFLRFGDKYERDNNGGNVFPIVPMLLIHRTTHHDWFSVVINPPYRRLAYDFLLDIGDQRYVFHEEGSFVFARLQPNDRDVDAMFQFPYINEADIIRPPNGFPRLFFTRSLLTVSVDWTDDNVDSVSFYGGDLQGIIQKIPYFKQLGINAIYLTPIFQSTTNHRYDTTDYKTIDPILGNDDDFAELVEQAHLKKIKIIIDAVFNHCGDTFRPFLDAVAQGRESKYYNWFHFHDDGTYDRFGFHNYMPKLNTEEPLVRDYLLSIADRYTRRFAIDGWRLDVANEVDHCFWRDFRKTVKSIKPDVYILGELWHNGEPWLRGDQFDAIMAYQVSRATRDFLLRSTPAMSRAQFEDVIVNYMMSYPKQVVEAMFNLLGSHDTPRALTEAGANDEVTSDALKRVQMAYLFIFTCGGAPCVYYGDEQKMTGGADPGCRKPMRYLPNFGEDEFFKFFQTIIELKKHNPILSTGEFRFLQHPYPFAIVIERFIDNQSVFILLNRGSYPISVSLNVEAANLRCLVGTHSVTNSGQVSVAAEDFCVLQL
ncbi:hypothetical protein GEMRC1_002018 [Eukaryota sp. GEM-RC1]